jgi:hypothetical protein
MDSPAPNSAHDIVPSSVDSEILTSSSPDGSSAVHCINHNDTTVPDPPASQLLPSKRQLNEVNQLQKILESSSPCFLLKVIDKGPTKSLPAQKSPIKGCHTRTRGQYPPAPGIREDDLFQGRSMGRDRSLSIVLEGNEEEERTEQDGHTEGDALEHSPNVQFNDESDYPSETESLLKWAEEGWREEEGLYHFPEFGGQKMTCSALLSLFKTFWGMLAVRLSMRKSSLTSE